MQLLFLFLFGGVVSFILYLSYDKHVTDKKKANQEDELKVDLNKYSDVIETQESSVEEIFEKVEQDVATLDEPVKFKARRNKEKSNSDEEEII